MAKLLLSFGALALAQVLDDPAITAAPESTEVALFPNDPSATGEPCNKVVCYDYINTCSIRYGGCYPACGNHARPTYSGATCEGGRFRSSFSKSFVTTQTNPCGQKCDYITDSCGNTFGPGCYTSCPGVEPPSYTIPSCDAVVTPAETVYVTPVPAVKVVPLFVPLDALDKRQEDLTVSSDTTPELVATSEAVPTSDLPATITSNFSLDSTPEPSLEGATTTDADILTVESQTTETPTATDIESSAPEATEESTLSSDVEATAPSSTDLLSTASATDELLTTTEATPPDTTSEAALSYTPEPISEGGATIGADLSTIEPQSTEVSAATSIDSSASEITDAPATSSDVDDVSPSSTDFASTTSDATDDIQSTSPETIDQAVASTTEQTASISDIEFVSATSSAAESPTAIEESLSASQETTSSASITETSTPFPAATDNNGLDTAPSTAADSTALKSPSPTVSESTGDNVSTAVSSDPPVTLWTPEPIPDGGATIGADLPTIAPTVYEYTPTADIMDPPQETEDSQAPVASADDFPATDTETSTSSVDGKTSNPALTPSEFVTISDIATEATPSASETLQATGIAISLIPWVIEDPDVWSKFKRWIPARF
ncbi:hypothetical protein Slin15195_G084340 [Septoria linicola]|uniref:Uncharacterized protein n=1 Tax=Septoria linicola TaxID=215465 RepID=A0A9Q9AU04_9PEZI|nr:hypothetical protein Slin15195_G084340 [Septoria linicola]